MDNNLSWNGIDLMWAYKSLLPSIMKKSQCKSLAQDILHDGFLCFAISSNPNRLQQPNAYLRRIVQNLAFEKYRKDTYLQNYLDTIAFDEATIPSPEHLADIKQRLVLLEQIIQDLPVRCREVFVLYRIEGHSQTDIADSLSISLNMVERHLIRAMLDIRAAREQLLV
jgi:RNA polymerase sigma-70 factor (ECF subfamily)